MWHPQLMLRPRNYLSSMNISLKEAGRILNSGQSRSIGLTGNIHDLFAHVDSLGKTSWVPLVELITSSWDLKQKMLVIYELNGPIRFYREEHRTQFKEAWLKFKTGKSFAELALANIVSPKNSSELKEFSQEFESLLRLSVGKPTMALEVLRQMCLCSRTIEGDQKLLNQDLIVIIEGADLILPEGNIHQLKDNDRHRVMICHDWFCDPGFIEGDDVVLLCAESMSQVHSRISRLPQLLSVEIPAPDDETREAYINWFEKEHCGGMGLKTFGSKAELVRFTGGLSIQALRQLLLGAKYSGEPISRAHVVQKVEQFIQSQLGEDVVEFKSPSHTISDLVGFKSLKHFLRNELIPRFRSDGEDALPGAAVGGAIGSGKTFIFEAVATELDVVVLVLKGIRSQWFGQTDIILERLRRVLNALSKVLIFVDEADTQFGDLGPNSHATEKRLTGKIQAMMSDPRMRGKVIWLLMTARIHRLSPDIRRPGRVGDLIIPILDPVGEDRQEFLNWVVKPVLGRKLEAAEFKRLDELTQDYFSASFAALRSELKARSKLKKLEFKDILSVVDDVLVPAISLTRRYQTLQALVNCTRKSLLPEGIDFSLERAKWLKELKNLEFEGVS